LRGRREELGWAAQRLRKPGSAPQPLYRYSGNSRRRVPTLRLWSVAKGCAGRAHSIREHAVRHHRCRIALSFLRSGEQGQVYFHQQGAIGDPRVDSNPASNSEGGRSLGEGRHSGGGGTSELSPRGSRSQSSGCSALRSGILVVFTEGTAGVPEHPADLLGVGHFRI